MPSRKQRRRQLKEKRHEYEFVYVDAEGNELDEPPEEVEAAQNGRVAARNGTKTQSRGSGGKTAGKTPAKKSQPPQRGARRPPPAPSWNRALKRGGLLGIVVFALFSFTSKGHLASVIPLTLLYTVMFVPFTYVIDRFAYRRWEAKQGGGATPSPRSSKKR